MRERERQRERDTRERERERERERAGRMNVIDRWAYKDVDTRREA